MACKNSKTYVISDTWGHMNERLVQENKENQAVIDLDICIGHYTSQLNKYTIQTPFLLFILSTLNSLIFFFFNPFSSYFSQLLKIHAIYPFLQSQDKLQNQHALWNHFMHNYQKNDKKKKYVNCHQCSEIRNVCTPYKRY